MIITLRKQISSEERNQLETHLGSVTGSYRATIATMIDEREVIVLDDSQLDKQALSAIKRGGKGAPAKQGRNSYPVRPRKLLSGSRK